jgi:hypothetical protein
MAVWCHKKQNTHSDLEHKNAKATFMYSVKEIRTVTKLFQDASENSFSYTACNRKHIKTQTTYTNKYSKSVILSH